MRYLIFLIILCLPALVFAQDFQFQLDPDAFPVTINNWQPYQPWAGGMDYSTPELCDLDNDGDLDLFIGDYCGYIKYFMNIGSATQPNFTFITDFLDSLHSPATTLGLAYGSDVVFVDLNGDGLRDALVGGDIGWGNSQTLIFYNTGTQSQPNFLVSPDTLRDDSGNYACGWRIASVDIDGDGDYDFFATQYDGMIRYYQNVGTPTTPQFYLVTSSWCNFNPPDGYTKPTFSDLDADGDLDLLVGTGDGTIYYYRNDGTPQNPQMTYVSNNYFGIDVGEDASPELADIDGDGDLDLFVGRSHWDNYNSGDVYFYQNIGTAQSPNYQLITKCYLTVSCGYFARPRLIDIDADGDPDLFSSINGYNLVLYRNRGTLANPHFVWETDNFSNITIPGACVPWFSDIDADGDYDLFIGPGAIPGPPGLYFFRNQGTPQIPDFVLESTNLVPGHFTEGSVVLYPCTADIDADGDQDLFVKDNLGCCYFFRNVGMPTNFQFQYVTSNWQNFTGPYYFMNFYDIDGDSDLDLFMDYQTVVSQPWGKKLRFYRNIGTPQNANMQLEILDMFPGLMIWSACPYVIDMDQDSDGDLFVGDQWGGIRYFKNVTGDTTAVLQPTKMRPRPSRATLTIGPNPSNPITAISYQLSAVSLVNLSVYDISGRRVAQLVNGKQNPGDYSVSWNAAGNASGVYLVRLEASGSGTTPTTAVGKVVILK